jgi:hypothetical protein
VFDCNLPDVLNAQRLDCNDHSLFENSFGISSFHEFFQCHTHKEFSTVSVSKFIIKNLEVVLGLEKSMTEIYGDFCGEFSWILPYAIIA